MDSPSKRNQLHPPASQHRNICVVGDDDQCLAAGTFVTTPDGEKKIEAVVAGDLVLSGHGADEAQFYQVVQVSRKPYHGSMLRITAGNIPHLTKGNSARLRAGRSVRQLCLKPNHICFTKHRDINTRGNAIILQAFDRGKQAFDLGERSSYVRHSVCRVSEKGFNVLEVIRDLDEAEEFCQKMARTNGGLEIRRFAFFGYSSSLYQFMPAMDLEVGMKVTITMKKGPVRELPITRIEEEHYDGLVYDLDVPKVRNFAANGVLVHDSTHASR